MNVPPDPRLDQKIANFLKALQALDVSVLAPVQEARDLSGIIKDFEIAYELSWKMLKAFLEKQGHMTGSAKDVFSKAFQLKFINDENVWIDMIQDRNLAVRTYDQQLARRLVDHIRDRYVSAFKALGQAVPS